MKKGTFASAFFMLALAAGAFTGLSGCSDEKLVLNHNTKITALESALAQENYTTIHETTDNNCFKQVVNMYDENFALTIINQQGGATDKFYSFINYEGDNLLLYQIHQANNVEGVLNAGGEFKIISAEKQLASYGDIVRDLGNLNLLATAEGKLVPKDSATTLRFGNGTISTTDTSGTKITIMDIGTTRIDLSGAVLTSANHAAWQDELVIDGVKYVLQNNTYVAVLDNEFWATHARANILPSVNTLDVVEVQQNGTLASYAGRTITLPIETNNGALVAKNDFCFNLAEFVEMNGRVEFLNQAIEKTPITQTTTLEELENIINNKNYTFFKSKTSILSENTNKDYITENITYQSREYMRETIQIVGGQKFLKVEYGIFVGGVYYQIAFTNYDSTGHIYDNNALLYSSCQRVDPDEQVNLGAEVLTRITENNGELELIESSSNYAEMSFEYGNLTITTLFGEKNNDGAFENFGNEVIRLENVSTSFIDVPEYVIEAILQQDNANPLN